MTNLGLSAESVFSYHIGDIVRTKGRIILYYIGMTGENLSSWVCEQQRGRPACASAQTN